MSQAGCGLGGALVGLLPADCREVSGQLLQEQRVFNHTLPDSDRRCFPQTRKIVGSR